MDRPDAAPTTRTALSTERVLQAAVALAERNGFEALTMRKLADELGVGVMSLYHYFGNKDELLDAMVDIVFGEIELPPTDVDWRTAMRRRALSTREVLNRHRWAVGLMESRRTPGPASFRLHDAVLGCLREAGVSVEQTIQAYSVQDANIYGFRVDLKANKVQIRQAVEKIWGVKVVKVATMIRKGKPTRSRYTQRKKPDTKIALVKLAYGQTLVTRQGGKIFAESEPGRGTPFSIWLPEAA